MKKIFELKETINQTPIKSARPNFSNFSETQLSDFNFFLVQLFKKKITCADSSSPYQYSSLLQAMQYSLLNGGKRIRALLVYATGLALGADIAICHIAAAAVEMVHAFSLIHDDLPAMDDDVLRRGLPTCHIQFDEATAILAGDALHTEAFDLLSHEIKNPTMAIQMIQTLSRAIGKAGMVQGQTMDIQKKAFDLNSLKIMHHLKTGCLITASAELGYLSADLNQPELQKSLKIYGRNIGLAFQIKDDLLDQTSTTAQLGKTAKSDSKNQKITFVSLLGKIQAEAHMYELLEQALESIKPYEILSQSYLPDLAKQIIERAY